MASISTPAGLAPRPQARSAALPHLGRVAIEFLTILGAASRVAQAVESRRPPAGADLQTLGITGPLPTVR